MPSSASADDTAIEWTALEPSERYRRVTWEGLLIIQRTDEYVWKSAGPDAWAAFSEATRPGWAGPIGRKLVAAHPNEFTPDIDGALKLMGVYNAEVWGGGHRESLQVTKHSETEGHVTVTNHACPIWHAFDPSMKGKFPCHKACGKEVDSVVKTGLGPEFSVETTEGRPLGHDNCVWHVTRKAG